MTLVVPNSAEVIILENFLNITAPEDLVIKLYTSDTIPSEGDTVADYTEATGGDYAELQLIADDWTVTSGAPTSASYPEVIFSFTGGVGNIYGYYIVRAVSGELLWAERFTNGPFNVQNNGDEIKVTPNITLE
jgi:hypothetical protein